MTFTLPPDRVIFMGKHDKLLIQILRGTSDANISFDDLCKLLINLGFKERIKGSHHIFTKDNIEEISPKAGNQSLIRLNRCEML